MSDAWMPGVKYVRAAGDGGPLRGGAPRVVWEALDADPRTVSARSAAQRLDKDGRASHLVWNPLTGEIVQLIPIVRAACSLGLEAPAPAGRPGPETRAEVNSEGRVCVQICVVAFTRDPFTAGPMAGLQEILTWLDSWGVPRSWPAGRPAPFPDCHATTRSRRLWARGGHFGESQVPGLTASGPGAIDVERLTGWSAAHSAADRPPDAAELSPGGRPVPAAGRPLPETGPPAGDYESAALEEFLGSRVVSAAALARVR